MVNLVDPIWSHADRAPASVALRSSAAEWTYAQLRGAVTAFAQLLHADGVSRNERIVLIAPTVPEFVIAYFGAQAVGSTVITMNTMATAAEIDYVLEDAGAGLIVAWHETAAAAHRAAESRAVRVRTLQPGVVAAEGDSSAHLPVDRSGTDTALLLYTSGTTGRPKGVQLTLSNVLDTARVFTDQLRLTEQDRFGTALPMFHVFGQVVCLNTALWAGASMSRLAQFEPAAMLEMIRRDRLTSVAGVPTMWNAMLQAATEYSPADFAELRLACSGGASLPGEVLREFADRFEIGRASGREECRGWGSAEGEQGDAWGWRRR